MGSKQFLDPIRLVSVTTTQRDLLTVATGDVIYNTTLGCKQTRVGSVWATDYHRRTFSDAADTVTADDVHVAQTGTLSASRTVTLPAASAYPIGQRLTIANLSATTPTLTFLLTIQRAGADTIVNELDFANTTSIVMRSPLGFYEFVSDGTSKWTVVGHGSQKPVVYWQHSNDIAIPDGIWTPLPWNNLVNDWSAMGPGFESLTTTIAAASNGLTLPTATITVASTAGFPSAGYITITGPPKLLTAVTSTVATDLFTKTAHGLTDTQKIKLTGLTNTTGISVLTQYFVRDATATTFKLATTPGGTAINLTGADDTGLVFWANDLDTVVGYTGTTGTTFTGCNTTATPIPRIANISTGTLATSQVVTGANCRFTFHTPYLYELTAAAAWDANDTGIRNIRLRDADTMFIITNGNDTPATNTQAQTVNVTSQPGIKVGQFSIIEVYQSSGGVLNTILDGIASPLLMAFQAGAA